MYLDSDYLVENYFHPVSDMWLFLFNILGPKLSSAISVHFLHIVGSHPTVSIMTENRLHTFKSLWIFILQNTAPFRVGMTMRQNGFRVWRAVPWYIKIRAQT